MLLIYDVEWACLKKQFSFSKFANDLIYVAWSSYKVFTTNIKHFLSFLFVPVEILKHLNFFQESIMISY